jgi:protocatechuate 3,4-dioxygenase beta subunit
MKYSTVLLLFSSILAIHGCTQNNLARQKKSTAQVQKVGGPCEGCEGIYEQAPSFDKLSWIDTLPDFREAGPKMVISGIIYKSDGKTPAPGVVLYVYHTDQTGRYNSKEGQTGWAKRHGYIRGWMKTNAKGEYKFYTLKPAHYPGTNIPAHIHPIIKEPDKNEYWIDEYLFDDDRFLTAEERNKNRNYGGNGILVLREKDGLLYGIRNIYLGKNIPDYPK